MIYEFKCKQCGKKKEIKTSVKEYLKMVKPICCDEKMLRDYSGVRFDSDGQGSLHWGRG